MVQDLVPPPGQRAAEGPDLSYVVAGTAGDGLVQQGGGVAWRDASMPDEVRSLGRTISRWRNQIIAWHRARVSNGPTEEVNNVVKRIKQIAFGITNFHNYLIRAWLYTGKPNWHLLATINSPPKREEPGKQVGRTPPPYLAHRGIDRREVSGFRLGTENLAYARRCLCRVGDLTQI